MEGKFINFFVNLGAGSVIEIIMLSEVCVGYAHDMGTFKET